MSLSERLRPGIEAAPWVIDEVRRLEKSLGSDVFDLAAAAERVGSRLRETWGRNRQTTDWPSPQQIEDALRVAALACAPAAGAAIPDGWKLVPMEPTSAMKTSALGVEVYKDSPVELESLTWEEAAAIYHAMLAVAPGSPTAQAEPLTQAAFDVLAERRRQIKVENFSAETDDHHNGELAAGAACYALNAMYPASQGARQFWPWDKSWWKPTTPRRDLVKAAAMILAEIERLDRAATKEA